MKEDRFYAMSKEEVYQHFQTRTTGLTLKEVQKRIEKYGKNELPKKKRKSLFQIFLEQLRDPIILLLIVAIIASIVVGEYTDAIVILLIITIDLWMGTIQERKASDAAEALSSLVKEEAKVERNEKESIIDSSELVPGDIIYLTSGDKITADIRLIETHNFTVDESTLTGESTGVEKKEKTLKNQKYAIMHQANMAFAGTSVMTGRAKGIVAKTGINTEIGKIATTMEETKEEKSPLTIRVEQFSKDISFLIIIVSTVIAVLLFYKHFPGNEILLSVIALAVSALPEGLPLALTMALTIASNRMAKHKVIAKKLYSVESLGSCTTIASDKTGTLTVNEQTAKKIVLPNYEEYVVTGTGYHVNGTVTGTNLKDAYDIAVLGVINNEAKFEKKELIGDSIDLAFLVLGEKMKVDTSKIEIIETIPYESENKYSAVFYKKGKDTYCTIKGSLEVITSFCTSIDKCKTFDLERLNLQNEDLARDGYRVIAIANGKVEEKTTYQEKDIKNLTFKGLVGFIDPIRKEVVGAIKKCKTAGIKVLMITGDHPLTAFKIAKDLKLTKDFKEVAKREEVEEYLEKGEEAFDEFVKTKKVFTRVTPMEKLKIVESLKRSKEFVAVTGDGVNDAPALRSANIGIAMGSGTDIAKETAKMIVLEDNFTSIVNGILEGRVAYSNIRKITYFLVSCGLSEVLFYLLAILTDLPIPLLAIQLLWLNVVTDGIQDFALSFERPERNVMKERPRSPKEKLFDRLLMEEIIVSGITIGLMVFGLWYYLIVKVGMSTSLARSYVMALMIIIQNVHAFNCRSEKRSAFSVSLSSNKIFLFGVFGSVLLGLAVMEIKPLAYFLKMSSIPANHLLGLVLLSLLILIIMECYKKIKYPRR